MRYISLFSGIEAASVAWEPLGWEPVAFSEIEPYCCELLKQRFPHVPNLGDICKIDWKEVKEKYGAIELIVGGSPCQSFSIAGKREGLRGASGLMYEYIRAVQELRPEWFVWENVPGALSSEGGAAFEQLLREMDALGYGLAWRVLDAQFFGVAQRRERVFLVGHFGDTRAAEVLFEPESLRGDIKSSKQKRAELTADLGRGSDGVHGDACLTPYDGQAVRVFNPYTADVGPSLQRAAGESGTPSKTIIDNPVYTLKLRHTGSFTAGGGVGPLVQDDLSATLSTFQDQTIFHQSGGFLYGAGAKARGIGFENENCPTLMTDCRIAVNQRVFGKTHRASCPEDHTTYEQTELANTLNTFDVGESRANEIVCMTDTQTNTTIVAGGGALGSLCARLYKDPPVLCSQTLGKSQAPYAPQTARRGSQGNHGEREKSCVRSGPDPICMGSDAAKSSIDVDLCGTLHVGGGCAIRCPKL